ncbi:hypothetical protein Q7P37_007972 [Cladosporium fusiforme]
MQEQHSETKPAQGTRPLLLILILHQDYGPSHPAPLLYRARRFTADVTVLRLHQAQHSTAPHKPHKGMLNADALLGEEERQSQCAVVTRPASPVFSPPTSPPSPLPLRTTGL